jgi:hypothetical protein
MRLAGLAICRMRANSLISRPPARKVAQADRGASPGKRRVVKRSATMLHYPPIVTEICKYCGAEVTLNRQGDGHPVDGRLDYWYTTDHHCVEGDQQIAAQENERRYLEDLLYGR